jgi:imidazolonepropionase-like amidohydrolase
MVKTMRRAGVMILAGADLPLENTVSPLHEELSLLVQAGLTPMEALQSATRNPAKFLGLNSSGTVERGKVADLVLLDANPLDDIANTKEISAVVAGGRYLSKEKLQEMLRGNEQR